MCLWLLPRESQFLQLYKVQSKSAAKHELNIPVHKVARFKPVTVQLAGTYSSTASAPATALCSVQVPREGLLVCSGPCLPQAKLRDSQAEAPGPGPAGHARVSLHLLVIEGSQGDAHKVTQKRRTSWTANVLCITYSSLTYSVVTPGEKYCSS